MQYLPAQLRAVPSFVRRYRRRSLVTAAALGSALAWLASSPSAYAYSFNSKGELAFDPKAIFTESFETTSSSPGLTVVSGKALDGKKLARIQTSEGDDGQAMISIPSLPSAAALRFRAFVRGNTSWYPIVSIYYTKAPGAVMSFASLSPTGRMTNDGWVELESAPISVDGARAPYLTLSISSELVEVDAIEVVEEPGAYKPSAPCSAPNPTSCGPSQFCVQGYCQDGDGMVPPLPAAAEINLVVDTLERKVLLSFGGVYTRKVHMPEAIAAMESMRTATHAWTFWSTLAKAVSLLHDSHTAPYGIPQFFGRGGKAMPVCFAEGDGDLSHAWVPTDPLYADVLVTHVGPDKNLGLKPGDRIVAVDGKHPIPWMEELLGLTSGSYRASDPTVHSGAVEPLASTITSFAETIQVIRCDPATGTCSAPETIPVASFPDDSQQVVTPSCDHRPSYHLAANNPDPVTHEFDDVRYGLLADSAPGEDFYGVIWNDTMWDGESVNPWEEAYSALRANAKGVILDHRRGDGGTPQGAAYLTELSLQPKKASVWSTIGSLGLFDEPFSKVEGSALWDMWNNDESRTWVAGSSSPIEAVRIAVLLARDVSGSDFFPFGVKGAANTRLFGRRTMGAFSTFRTFEMPSYFLWSLASGDFIDPSGKPQIGHGVEPDENILPTQSDLLVGRDTVYERALSWVRCGKAVCP